MIKIIGWKRKKSYTGGMNASGSGMKKRRGRMRREHETIAAMISIYCRGHHEKAGGELCGPCTALLAYANHRLDRCPFQDNKTTCARCAVHCYEPGMREKVRTVMKYAGPRMIHRHPILALFHFLDGFR